MGIKEQFDSVSKKYDEQRKLFLPCFEDFYLRCLEMVEFADDCPRVLDIGSGTGLFTSFLLEKYPNAKVTLIDLSEKMLDIAKKRFQGNENIEYIIADYTNYEFGSEFDIIISALSIHHLNAENKKKLYNNCFNWLDQNGVFINADQVLSEFVEIENKFTKIWREQVENCGLSQEEIQKGYLRVSFDDPSTLSQQLNWLNEAGFSTYDIVYKYYQFCVFYAKKACGRN